MSLTFFPPRGGDVARRAHFYCVARRAHFYCPEILPARHEFDRKYGIGGFPFRSCQARHLFIYLRSLLV